MPQPVPTPANGRPVLSPVPTLAVETVPRVWQCSQSRDKPPQPLAEQKSLTGSHSHPVSRTRALVGHVLYSQSK